MSHATSSVSTRPEARSLRPLVAIVEDHPLYRQALEAVINDEPSLELMMSASTIEEFEARVPARPDVVLLDLHLPGVCGAEGIRRLSEQGHTLLVLTASNNGNDVVGSIKEGAQGYLSKESQAGEIVRACQTLAAGRGYVAPTLASHLLHTVGKRQPALPELSDREREVLAHLARGNTDQDIAKLLSISVSTVRSHLDRIRDKTGQRRRAELTRFAMENALVEV
jgi:DNA-binding NarL/FixJ family response regulator